MIKFIYFDIGGVVILDFSKTNKWNQMLADLKISGSKKEKFEELFNKFELETCVGRNAEEFLKIASEEIDINFPENYSFLNDFVNRFEKNTYLWPIIEKAKEKYKIGLLTNMYYGMLDAIKMKDLLPDISWDVVIDSSVVKFQKPQDEIYVLAEEHAAVKPEEIFFVENSNSHIEAARLRGWQTFLYDPYDISKSNSELNKLFF